MIFFLPKGFKPSDIANAQLSECGERTPLVICHLSLDDAELGKHLPLRAPGQQRLCRRIRWTDTARFACTWLLCRMGA